MRVLQGASVMGLGNNRAVYVRDDRKLFVTQRVDFTEYEIVPAGSHVATVRLRVWDDGWTWRAA